MPLEIEDFLKNVLFLQLKAQGSFFHFISGPPWSKGGNFSPFLVNFYGTYERELVIIDITMACDLSFYWFFPN